MQCCWAKRAFSNYKLLRLEDGQEMKTRHKKEIKTADLPSLGEGVGVEAQRKESMCIAGAQHAPSLVTWRAVGQIMFAAAQGLSALRRHKGKHVQHPTSTG